MHLNTILFAEFAIYFYRDVVPLGTFTLAPLDGNEGNILWAFIAVLGFTSIIIPLGIPSRYLPYDPSVCPSPEFIIYTLIYPRAETDVRHEPRADSIHLFIIDVLFR